MTPDLRKTFYPLLRCAAMLAALCLSTGALAQNVALAGVMGKKALLVVDGAAPKWVDTGSSHAGVKLVNVSGEEAWLEIGGQKVQIRVGQAPVSQGASGNAAGTRIVLPMGSGGHFLAQGSINGRSMQFMVDTGATSVAIGQSDAQRMGIDYQKGQPIRMNTANGVAQGWLVRFRSVRIGDVEVYDVEGVVGPNMPYALLGNSFLSRFTMNRSSDTMVLERRY